MVLERSMQSDSKWSSDNSVDECQGRGARLWFVVAEGGWTVCRAEVARCSGK